VIALGVSDAECPGTKSASCSGKSGCGCQRCAWNFEQNLRRWRGRAPYCHQSATRANIQCGSKLKEFLAIFIPGTHEDRDSQGQSHPLPTFFFGLAAYQGVPWRIVITPPLWASWLPNIDPSDAKPRFLARNADLYSSNRAPRTQSAACVVEWYRFFLRL